MNRQRKQGNTIVMLRRFSILRIRGSTTFRRSTMDKIHRIITILSAFGNIFIAIAAIRDSLVAFFDDGEVTEDDQISNP